MPVQSENAKRNLGLAIDSMQKKQMEPFIQNAVELLGNTAYLAKLLAATLEEKAYEFSQGLIELLGRQSFLQENELSDCIIHHALVAASLGQINDFDGLCALFSGLNVISTKTKAEAFLKALDNGHYRFALDLLERGLSVNAKNHQGQSLLSIALLAWCQLKKQQEALSQNQLAFATFLDNIAEASELISLLIDKGADIDLADENGQKPIDIAANTPYVELLDILKPELEDVADKLEYSFNAGYIDWFSCLFEQAKRVIKPFESLIQDAFAKAIINDKVDFIDYLLSEGADALMPWKNQTPLYVKAFNENHLQAAEAIFKWYYQQGKILAVDELNDRGKILHRKLSDKYRNEHPLILLAKGVYQTINFETFNQRGMDVNFLDEFGQGPLYYAILNDNEDLVKKLLENGANIHQANKKNLKPYQLAFSRGNETIITDIVIHARQLALMPLQWTPKSSRERDRVTSLCKEIGYIEPHLIAIVKKPAKDGSHLAKIDALVAKGADINGCGDDKKSALIIALDNEDIQTASHLLKYKNIRAEISTHLENCIKTKKEDLAKLLLRQFFNDNATDNKKNIDIMVGKIIQSGSLSLLDFCVSELNYSCHMELSLRSKGTTLVCVAAFYGQTEIISYLKEKGLSLSPKANGLGNQPIHHASYGLCQEANKDRVNEYLETMRLLYLNSEKPVLLNANPRPDERVNKFVKKIKQEFGQQLKDAVLANDKEKIEALIAKGVDINEQDEGGNNALHHAMHLGNSELALWLVNKGVCINSRNHQNEMSLFMAIEKDDADLINAILAKGVSLNVKNKLGQNPLMFALSQNKSNAISCLFNAIDKKLKGSGELGINVHDVDNTGFNVLHHAVCQNNKMAALKLLRKFKALINSQNALTLDTSLHLANQINNEDERRLMLGLLFYWQPKLTLKNKQGQLPIDASFAMSDSLTTEHYLDIANRQKQSVNQICGYYNQTKARQLQKSLLKYRAACLKAYLKGCDSFENLSQYAFVNQAMISEKMKRYLFKQILDNFSKAISAEGSFYERLKVINHDLISQESHLIKELDNLENDIYKDNLMQFSGEKESLTKTKGATFFDASSATTMEDNKNKKDLMEVLQKMHHLNVDKPSFFEKWQGGSWATYYTIPKTEQSVYVSQTLKEMMMLLDRFSNKGTYLELKLALSEVYARSMQRNPTASGRSEALNDLLETLSCRRLRDQSFDGLLNFYREYPYLPYGQEVELSTLELKN